MTGSLRTAWEEKSGATGKQREEERTWVHSRAEKRARREGLYDSALLRGIVVGGVGQGALGKRTRRCWTEGETERETERVVEKRWQKEETKGDRV